MVRSLRCLKSADSTTATSAARRRHPSSASTSPSEGDWTGARAKDLYTGLPFTLRSSRRPALFCDSLSAALEGASRVVDAFQIEFWPRTGPPGRPPLDCEVAKLVRTMALANPLWGAPRIHGELLKLGLNVSQRTVGRLMPRRAKPPPQTWRTFLQNHVADLVSVDFFLVVPTEK